MWVVLQLECRPFRFCVIDRPTEAVSVHDQDQLCRALANNFALTTNQSTPTAMS